MEPRGGRVAVGATHWGMVKASATAHSLGVDHEESTTPVHEYRVVCREGFYGDIGKAFSFFLPHGREDMPPREIVLNTFQYARATLGLW